MLELYRNVRIPCIDIVTRPVCHIVGTTVKHNTKTIDKGEEDNGVGPSSLFVAGLFDPDKGIKYNMSYTLLTARYR